MRQLLIALIVLLSSSIYVLGLSSISASPYVLQKSLVLPIIIFFLFLYFSSYSSWKQMLIGKQKWLSLFLCAIFVQILILSTGGITSPFLILIHLAMIGLSFIFSFWVAILFLFATLAIIMNNASFFSSVTDILSHDPTTLTLQAISFMALIPLSYIISEHYHFQDLMMKKFHKQALTDETIFKSLDELVIITDLNLHILSINDAVERTLHKSSSELLSKPLFDVLLLKDETDQLVVRETFFINGDTKREPQKISGYFTLMKSPTVVQKKFRIHVQPTKDLEDAVDQISFILNDSTDTSSLTSSLSMIVDRSRARYEAMSEKLKKDLLVKSPSQVRNQLIMLEKIEDDLYHIQTLKESPTKNVTQLDLAQLGKRAVFINQDFAKIFNVLIDFALHNFSVKDIAPLTVNNFSVKPEHLTGPFFTAECDTKQTESAIKKLLDVAILIAAKEKNAQVILSVDRGKNEDIIIAIEGKSPKLTIDELNDIFSANYGSLANKTSLHAGSGLEGYLAKTILDNMDIKLETQYKEESSTLSFKLSIPKKK